MMMPLRVARVLRARAGQKAEEDEASDRHRDSAPGEIACRQRRGSITAIVGKYPTIVELLT